jgi:hypothetical protein
MSRYHRRLGSRQAQDVSQEIRQAGMVAGDATSGDVHDAFHGSDADATRALYLRLIERGPLGDISVNLLRAMKASQRAKLYRGKPGRGGPSYRAMAYDKKSWALGELCKSLEVLAADLGIRLGWGKDRSVHEGHDDVLYVDLPGAGQVSFHSPYRGAGPDYAGAWDGVRGAGIPRTIRFATAVLATGEPPQPEEQQDVARQDRPEREDAARAAGTAVQHEGGGRQEAFDL